MVDLIGAALGGVFYDALKYASQNAVSYIKDKVKETLPKLLLNNEQIGRIAERVETLGLAANEDKPQYLQRISQDKQLQQLLSVVVNDHSITQNVSASPGAIVVGGNYVGGNYIGGNSIGGDSYEGANIGSINRHYGNSATTDQKK